MEWWQSFVGAGTFACLVLLVRVLQKDSLYIAQEVRYGFGSILARLAGAFVFQFILWGVLIGTPVWFGYWLIS